MIGPLVDWGWVSEHSSLVVSKLLEHVELTLIAVVVGLAISLPLGVYAHRHKWAYPPVTWFAGILYTIPSIALFVMLIPITGLSVTTVEVALVSYTLLILIRNIVAGLDGVSADVKEAARGMGLSDRQILWRVELPLALPVIVAGVRVATVSTIGLITIAALLGRGGLGYFILLGFYQFFATAALLGAVLSALLAIAADGAILLAERRLAPWTRPQSIETFS